MNVTGLIELSLGHHDDVDGSGDHVLLVLILLQPRQDNERAAAEPRGL